MMMVMVVVRAAGFVPVSTRAVAFGVPEGSAALGIIVILMMMVVVVMVIMTATVSRA